MIIVEVQFNKYRFLHFLRVYGPRVLFKYRTLPFHDFL